MWLTGALHKLANRLLALFIHSLLASLEQRVSQSDLGGVLLWRRPIGRQRWDESTAVELVPAALRIGGSQTASTLTYIYRHLLLRRALMLLYSWRWGQLDKIFKNTNTQCMSNLHTTRPRNKVGFNMKQCTDLLVHFIGQGQTNAV